MRVSLLLLVVLKCCLLHRTVQEQSSGSGLGLGCSSAEFECASSGVCIPEGLVCNGNAECLQGEDEAVCTPPRCAVDQFRCGSDGNCISLWKVCDGLSDCQDQSDETSCGEAAPGSVCGMNQFSCSSRGPCVPLAFLCNGVGDCPNGDDESRCESPRIEVHSLEEISVEAGDTITLSCAAIGYPPPFITWRKNLQPIQRNFRYNYTSGNGFGVLRIHDAGLGDAGEYHCEMVSGLHGAQLVLPSVQVLVEDPTPSMCLDHRNRPYHEDVYYYDVRPVGVGAASQAAADIVFVVDESGSMAMEHEWLREEAGILNRLLMNRGIGAGERGNQYALIGFGRNDPAAILGTTLTELTTLSNFVVASQNLQLTGAFEDGYSAIQHALESIVTRPNTARLLVLITDEDRGVLNPGLSREGIEEGLQRAGYVLNVVVNQGFQTSSLENTSFALGVSSNAAYLLDTNATSLFSVVSTDTIIRSNEIQFGSTYEDYVELALSVGGAAWDLNQLREQGLLARAFTNAFSEVKVQEVMTVFSYCFGCLCRFLDEVCTLAESVDIENCVGTFPVLESAVTPEVAFVASGSDVTFQCLAFTNFPNLSVSYVWTFPPQLATQVTVDGTSLTLSNADRNAEVNFTCTVMLETTALMAVAMSTLIIDTRCQLPDWSYLVLGGMRRVLVPRSSNQSQAADVVLLVDESGSMIEEHTWIAVMTKQLDQALKDIGVGLEAENRFGVVGFGDDCNEGNEVGRVLLGSMQEQFAFAENITKLTRGLNVGGRSEDGYSAIRVALDSYAFRNVAKQLILITDEDRDAIAENLTRDSVQMLLEDAGIQLNAAISEEFEGDNLRALGIDGQDNAYIYDPSIRTLFRVLEGSGASIMDSAYGSTNTDYTQLALGLGGAAWDLTQLRQGGGVAEAFTNAFVQVKVLEIQSQLSRCLDCTCTVHGSVCNMLPSTNFSFCMATSDPSTPGEMPLAVQIEGPSEVSILPAESRSFTCRSNFSAVMRWTFNGGNLPSNARVSSTGGYMTVLTIEAVLPGNEGTYTCLAHSQGGGFRGSASISTIFYDPEQDLMLVLAPLQSVVTRGNNITVACSVQSPSTISWMFADGPLPLNSVVSNIGSNSSLLTLFGAEEANTGPYTCIAASVDRNVENEDTAYLEVRDPQLRLVIVSDVVTVEVGAIAELSCIVDCFCPEVLPEWSRSDNTPLPDMATVTVSGEPGGRLLNTLLIPVTSSEDGGRYLCSAELEGDSVSAVAYLNVTEESGLKVRILGHSPVEITAGDSHSLVCEANQNGSSIVWRFNNMEVPVQQSGGSGSSPFESEVPSNVVAIEVSQMRTVLSLLEASNFNSGRYQCIATSRDDEEAVAEVELLVQ